MAMAVAQAERNKPLEDLVRRVQQGDRNMADFLLQNYQPFIKKTVAKVCKRYIDHKDDEFSIGLMAFHDSMMKYDNKKGASLLPFAEVMIKRKVIDYIRQVSKHKAASLDVYGTDEDETAISLHIEQSASIAKYRQKLEEESRKAEILRFASVLHTYGIRFEDLIRQGPKHRDAKLHALKAAKVLYEDKELLSVLDKKRRIPLKQLEEKVEVSRKTLERNRKYIIALVLIMNGDFHFLKEYVK
ncbi:RNA polymerase sigma factor SigI [Weizmannia acidilactici]|uniref:RNA polymerase sigma factor SigI n=1 Tax=Weizmannia acidilactici TaxID=2607726 RepID=A0A5J4JJ63_9BACI|nr:RNA polymerase sigma-I factor [Weizmannia acidilactici]GER68148.1 RNA polymerase sigma factor SigI [Weizmannia acidilactici]GER71811.1 RNA polymerase sigma factor SigI [Weizmannia acidilactici]GER74513.1 RNA polymerase sigma factor SigI [Weizmannia acidilactici]